MEEADDLDINPMFRALQDRYAKLFNWVQQKRGIVLIPCTSSILQVVIDEPFIEFHLLQPSPFQKDHYVRPGIAGREECCIEIDGRFVVTQYGYPGPSRRIRILGEELGYNKNSEQFRILIIERPLVGGKTAASKVPAEVSKPVTLNSFTLASSKLFLASFTTCREVIEGLDTELRQFRSNYIVLAGFLDDAAGKLLKIWTNAVDLFISTLVKTAACDYTLTKNINIALECYVLGTVHNTLWPAVCSCCESEDGRLTDKTSLMRQSNFSQQISAKKYEFIDFSRAKSELDQLSIGICPKEKISSMKRVMFLAGYEQNSSIKSLAREKLFTLTRPGDAITNAVASMNDGLACSSDTSAGETALSSDDYITLLVMLIISHGGERLMSNISYVDKFQMYFDPNDSWSFAQVTFKAACKFITSVSTGQLQPNLIGTAVVSTESSSDDMDATKIKSRADRELERLARMLEVSTRIINDVSKAETAVDTSVTTTEPDVTFGSSTRSTATSKRLHSDSFYDEPHQTSRSPLGDFISSLKNDSTSISYGRQN